MIVWPLAERPMVFAFFLFDRQIVNAGNTTFHQTKLIELPIFISVRTKPGAAVIMPLICKAYGDTVALSDPKSLD